LADLGFDETMVYCKITTNFSTFRFPTATMGTLTLDAHEFYMEMRSIRITSVDIVQSTDGPQATFEGVLRSETRLFSGSRKRTFVEEQVRFGCRAVKLGPGASVEVSNDNFSMTANFDPQKEHARIFGQKATFSGHLTQGNIIVVA